MYHFIGIQGAGMSALAVLLKKLGYEVKGSDLPKHFFTETELINNNITVTSYDEKNISENLIIVRGLSITDENVELKKAKELKLEIIDYDTMVGKITQEFKTICVAGCHGKTTTTSMISLVLDNIKGCNYLIGDGTGNGKKSNEYFALESCEYRRHFLSYTPYYAIILNIDLDHVDYFKDLDDITKAYNDYANKATKMVVAYGDDANVKKMNLNKPVTYFGFENNNSIQATNINYTKEGTSFDVIAENKLFGHFDLPIFGTHQVLDALATISVCYLENIEANLIQQELQKFTGAKRRFTETKVGNCIIIDDYAHHPNEIKATINAIKQKYPDKLVISIFQPHTFTRTAEFAKDIARELSRTDFAYIMDIHPAREKQEDYPQITKDIIIKEMNNAYSLTINDSEVLSQYDNAVFIFMSPNDVSKLEQDLIKSKQE